MTKEERDHLEWRARTYGISDDRLRRTDMSYIDRMRIRSMQRRGVSRHRVAESIRHNLPVEEK